MKLQTYTLLLAVIVLKPVSNLFFAGGLKAFPHELSMNPAVYIWALANPIIAAAVAMQILWLLGRMALLSRVDLSFVLPATASGYIISALLGHFFLAEQITVTHAIGILFIFLGSTFVGATRFNTTEPAISISSPDHEASLANFSEP